MRKYRLGFIGAGNMSEAIARAILGAGVYQANELCAFDPAERRRRLFREEFRIDAVPGNAALVAAADVVVYAAKPQQTAEILDEVRSTFLTDQLLISIAAGVSTAYFETGLGKAVPVVRVMPNQPLLVGAGMTALAKGRYAADEDLTLATRIFGSAGATLVTDEANLDAITALSGSGPAYFFYLVEAMIQAALDLGLGKTDATRLAAQTALGAARMLLDTQASPEELRRRVTSPGGTTEAAMEVLTAADTKRVIVDALKAAARRAKQLGR